MFFSSYANEVYCIKNNYNITIADKVIIYCLFGGDNQVCLDLLQLKNKAIYVQLTLR